MLTYDYVGALIASLLFPLVLVPLILAVLLFAYRGHFRVVSAHRLRRRVFWSVGLTVRGMTTDRFFNKVERV